MTDDEFLAYCEAHARTPRCGFVPSQLARLCKLANRPLWASFWGDQPNRVVDCEPDRITHAVDDARRFSGEERRDSVWWGL